MSIRRLVLGHAVFALVASSAALAGCGSDTQPTAKVYINSFMTAGTNGTQVCGVTDPTWVEIGTAAASVTDGDSDATGAPVHASCSVTSNSDGSFQVNAIGTLGSTGSITVTGKFTTSGDQSGIRAVFQRGDFGHFEESDCTVSYSSLGPPPTFSPVTNQFAGVAAGRVWGTVTCPSAADASQQRMNDMNMSVPRACKGVAEFKFENCTGAQ